MFRRVLAAAVVAAMAVAVYIMEWMDPEEYDEERDWPEPEDYVPDDEPDSDDE